MTYSVISVPGGTPMLRSAPKNHQYDITFVAPYCRELPPTRAATTTRAQSSGCGCVTCAVLAASVARSAVLAARSSQLLRGQESAEVREVWLHGEQHVASASSVAAVRGSHALVSLPIERHAAIATTACTRGGVSAVTRAYMHNICNKYICTLDTYPRPK